MIAKWVCEDVKRHSLRVQSLTLYINVLGPNQIGKASGCIYLFHFHGWPR